MKQNSLKAGWQEGLPDSRRVGIYPVQARTREFPGSMNSASKIPLSLFGKQFVRPPAEFGCNTHFCHAIGNITCSPTNVGQLKQPVRASMPSGLIRPRFLDSESRQDLIELTRDGSAAHRLARRANALVLLDDGMSCEAVAQVPNLDDDTIRTWHRLYQEDGIEGLASFGYEGGACRLTGEQRALLKAWIAETLPRTT